MQKRYIYFLGSSLLILAFAQLFIFSSELRSDDELYQKQFNTKYGIFSILQPQGLSFAGEEIPINSEETQTNSQETPSNVEDAPTPKKKRGRPVGAKSKAKPKVKKAPVIIDSEESEEEEPPPPKKKRTKRPADDIEEYHPPLPTSRDVAMEVLGMLSHSHTQRANQRRSKYASWFS